MLGTNIRDAPNFIQNSLSSMRKSHLKCTHEVLSEVLKNKSSDFVFWLVLSSGYQFYKTCDL